MNSDLFTRLKEASSSFHNAKKRHVLKTQDVIYCSFNTPAFSVPRDMAQRDAGTRITQFGLPEQMWEGARVLDLGSNNGAMLFELTNHKINYGLGVEYDIEKVRLARDIAAFSGLSQLEFRQGNIDELVDEKPEVFDIVLALAIEKHISKPDKLFDYLGLATARTLCFEGNSGCPQDWVTGRLRAVGFRKVEYRGFCTDDIRPTNNRRPVFVAHR